MVPDTLVQSLPWHHPSRMALGNICYLNTEEWI